MKNIARNRVYFWSIKEEVGVKVKRFEEEALLKDVCEEMNESIFADRLRDGSETTEASAPFFTSFKLVAWLSIDLSLSFFCDVAVVPSSGPTREGRSRSLGRTSCPPSTSATAHERCCAFYNQCQSQTASIASFIHSSNFSLFLNCFCVYFFF